MQRAILILVVALLPHAMSCAANAEPREQVTIFAHDYVEAARRALLAELDLSDGRVEVQPRGGYRDLELSLDGAMTLRARVANARELPNAAVWVEVSIGERIVRRMPVHFQVRWFKPALVAKSRMPARTALSPDMFTLQEVDVAPVRGAAVVSIAQLQGKRLRRELDTNAVLGLSGIEDRPCVEIGERIEIAARVGRVIVHRVAIALRDGHPGQRINARLPDTGEMLNVQVVGDNRAEVAGDG